MSDRWPVTTSNDLADVSRVRRSKAEAIAWYDRLAPWYDAVVSRFGRRPRQAGIQLLSVEPEEQVLEIGSRTGRALVAFARAARPTGHVIGVDASGGMCAEASKAVRRAGVDESVSLIRGDAARLPLADGTVDAVFSSFTLELFDTPVMETVLKECERVLSENGRLCVVSLSKGNTSLLTRAYERVHERYPRYADCRPIYTEKILQAAGFTVVTRESVPLWGLRADVVLTCS